MGINIWENPPNTIILQEQMRDSVEFMCLLQERVEQGRKEAWKVEEVFEKQVQGIQEGNTNKKVNRY